MLFWTENLLEVFCLYPVLDVEEWHVQIVVTFALNFFHFIGKIPALGTLQAVDFFYSIWRRFSLNDQLRERMLAFGDLYTPSLAMDHLIRLYLDEHPNTASFDGTPRAVRDCPCRENCSGKF